MDIIKQITSFILSIPFVIITILNHDSTAGIHYLVKKSIDQYLAFDLKGDFCAI